tara:strand:+ start:608 stop:868 length:261 start_codon:yes stop_codon:yes gene_type:complete
MFKLFLALVLMPVVVLAALGGDVTWFAMFASEVAVALFFLVAKHFSNDAKSVTSNVPVVSNDESFFEDSFTMNMRNLPPMFDDDEL